jgi:molybdopterin molybdotransferase
MPRVCVAGVTAGASDRQMGSLSIVPGHAGEALRAEPAGRSTHRSGIAWGQAHAVAAESARPLDVQQVGLAGAAGRVLAAPVYAAMSLPGFDTAAMDGYVVAGPSPWRVAGRVVTGCVDAGRLAPGTAVEITTGAMLPAGADAVVPYETCRHDGILLHAPAGGRGHIRRAGEDLAAGELLAGEGTVVSAALLGLIAHAGVDLVQVHRQARVLVVVTGDEVTTAGIPGPGRVRDALGPLLTALVGRCGAVVTGERYLLEGADVLRTTLSGGSEDVVVVTGSASVGLTDHLRAVLAGLGARLLVDGVACRPGHPQLLARLPAGGRVVGLPGNPYAALVACLTLLQPLLEALGGRRPRPPWDLPVTGEVTPWAGGVRLVPVRVQTGAAQVVDGARPASLRAAATADALACIQPGWVSGAPAQLLPLP